MNQNREIRTRFAPSPTGALHLGGMRTALFCYLFAKKNNGKFILRIEDTDQTRLVKGAENYIVESLQWAGLTIDEGDSVGGDYAPYRQSDRKHLYKKYADYLLETGNAYYAFDDTLELDEIRKKYEKESKTFKYDTQTRKNLINGLTLSEAEVKQKIDEGKEYVIRFKIPENTTIVFEDIIRGKVEVSSNELDDKVLMKSDGMPTYHLANVVDDYLMKISHVIRGEEWLPSAPLHVLLYRALNWENEMPEFAHLPLILKPDGKGKLSKRDGDRLGFPVFPIAWHDDATNEIWQGFRERGFLPDAFINMLAFVGWNPGTEQEFFSKSELIQAFDLSRVSKHGAKFDFEKAKWFNQHYIKLCSNETLTRLIANDLENKNIEFDIEQLKKIIPLYQDRITFHTDFYDLAKCFFNEIEQYDEQTLEKKWKSDSSEHILRQIIDYIKKENNFIASVIEPKVKEIVTSNNKSLGEIFPLLRIAFVGNLQGPDLMQTMEVLGKEKSQNRIDRLLIHQNKK